MERHSFLLVSFLLVIAVSLSCKKDKPELPPATTVGANTFGCKVNGKVFVPRDGNGRPGLYSQYVNLGEGEGGGWYLNISATDRKSSKIKAFNLGTDSLWLQSNTMYVLKRKKGFPLAEYRDFTTSNYRYEIDSTDAGQLEITRHDPSQRILSGSFWFDATNNLGEKVEVREGRFDIVY